MTDEIIEHVKIAKTDDEPWLIRVFSDNGVFDDEHILDAKPTVGSVRALLKQAQTHHDALERLVNR